MVDPFQSRFLVNLVTMLMLCTTPPRMAHVVAAQETPPNVVINAGRDRDEDLSKWQKIDESLAELQQQAEESLHPVAGGLWVLGLNEEWWEKLALTSEQRTLLRAAFTKQMEENTARR